MQPNPDIFLLAMRRLSTELGLDPPLRPEECIVFEDSEFGMLAGRAAGMPTFVIPDPNFTAEERYATPASTPQSALPSHVRPRP